LLKQNVLHYIVLGWAGLLLGGTTALSGGGAGKRNLEAL